VRHRVPQPLESHHLLKQAGDRAPVHEVTQRLPPLQRLHRVTVT
jgi:hypothetical protein